MVKRVYVHAYLSGNLGDDLFVRILCRRYPKVQFYLIADKIYKDRFRDLLNCTVYSEEDRRVRIMDRWLKRFHVEDGFKGFLIRHVSAVIHIGGSAFVQHFEDWSEFYKLDAYLVKNSRKMFVIGANFGPFTDSFYWKKYSGLFRRYRGICFRDSYSWQLFKDIPHVSWAPDVVFCMKADLSVKKRKVVVAPIELQHRTGKYNVSGYENDYLIFHVRTIKYLIRQGYDITLLSFCQFQQDDSMIQKICDCLTEKEKNAVFCMAYRTDCQPVLKEFSESEAVIGTRFHSIILGFLYQCRVLPLIYDLKTEKMLQDLGQPLSLHLGELNKVNIADIVKRWMEADKPDVSVLEEKAERQFQYTDDFLAG